MKFIAPQSIDTTQISVTGTATALSALMDAAGGNRSSNYYAKSGAGIVIIHPEGGSIRVAKGVDPTATKGLPLGDGGYYQIPMDDVSDFFLIATTGTVTCTVQMAKANGDVDFNAASESGGGGGTTSPEIQGNVAHDDTDIGNPVGIGGIAQSAQQAAVAVADRVKAVFNLFGEMVIAGYTWATNSIRTEEIDPLDQKYVGETLIDLTNIAQTTTAYAYIDMAGFRTLGIQAETSGATPTDVLTVTLEATMQDDGTAPASCDYQDVTNAITGSASFVDTDFISLIDTPFAVKYLRVKYTTSTGGGNDADLTVYTKTLY